METSAALYSYQNHSTFKSRLLPTGKAGSTDDERLQSSQNQRYELLSSSYAPLRIRFDTRLLEDLLNDENNNERHSSTTNQQRNDKIRTIIETTLPAAAELWAKHLSVQSLTNGVQLSTSACRRSLSESRTFPDADLVIIVAGDQLKRRCHPRQLAYASVCERSVTDDRPIVGKLEFCLENHSARQSLSPTMNGVPLAQEFQEHHANVVFHEDHLVLDPVLITAHEISHILGMGIVHYPYYRRSSNGAPRTPRNDHDGEPIFNRNRLCGNGRLATEQDHPLPSEDTIQVEQSTISGRWEHYLVTPRVKAVARNHLNCPTLPGARLQDEGHSCFGSHWHERWFFNHLLSPAWSKSSQNALSYLLLAALDDSGWYRVDYRCGTHPAFGLAAGCDFVMTDCIRNDTATSADGGGNEFCDRPTARISRNHKSKKPEFLDSHDLYCDPSHVQWTVCDLVDLPDQKKKAKHTHTYFSNSCLAPFRFQLADFCPVPDEGLGLDCRRRDDMETFTPFYHGERVGPDSRCFNAFYDPKEPKQGNESYTSTPLSRLRRRPACLLVTCDSKQGVIVHLPGNGGDDAERRICQFGGEVVSFGNSASGFYAEAFFVCPRLAILCPELYTCRESCWGRGECVYPEDPSHQSGPFCRCFDSANTDATCAPSFISNTQKYAATTATGSEVQAPLLAEEEIVLTIFSVPLLVVVVLALVQGVRFWKAHQSSNYSRISLMRPSE